MHTFHSGISKFADSVFFPPKFYLHMDGRGNYEFKKITDETVEFGS